ncbi:MAG TPA: Ig-like domain-containing protein, partial [Candidatus Dormibacteraeota bacterium]|nr:Ig-like domain-containing protein [Candidatus Dormibacteraeota bacterium]
MKPAMSTDGRRTRVRRRVSAALGILGIAALVCAQVQPARAAAPSSTLTTLSAAPSSPSTYGEYVTLTATVFPTSGTVPTGSVSFDEELVPGIVSSHLGDAPVVAAGNNGSASLAINTLSVGSHNLVAKYGGDAANLTSTSATLSYSVTKASTSTALSSSKNPSTSGDSVTFTAVVTSSGGTPTGTVNFADGGISFGTGALDGTGTATFSTSALTLGTHTITAGYGGDTNFNTSNSASLSQLVRAASTTALTAAPNPQSYGSTVTLTATVSGTTGPATGTVAFMDGASAIGSPVALDNTGKAVLATTALTTSGHSLTAVYSGDNAYSGSTSTVSTEGVQQATPTVALGASANPSPFGTQLDLTTTVTGPGGATAGPSGTVTVKDGSTVIGTATLSGGHATVSTATLAVGVHSLTAHYSSDTNYTSGADGTLSETVSKAATVTALGVAPSPGVSGQAVTLTATVTGSGGTPSGGVTFKDGSTTLGGGPVALGANGKATLSISTLAPGAHSLTAVYSGDGTYLASTSPAASETVLDLTTTTLSSSAAQATTSFGQSVSITATVTAQTLGGTPTGTVTFMDGATQLGTPVSLDVNGKAVYTSSALAVGAHSITAAYSGDAAFNTSTSSVLTETVTQASTTTALQSSTAGSVFGQEVDLTATITPANGGSPSGTVTFMDGATALGSPVAISGGTAVLATTTLPVGAHSITADYNGDGSFLTSTSSTVSVTVTQATTSTVLTSDLATPVHGQPVTLTATVSGPAGT